MTGGLSKVTPKPVAQHGLTPEEYERIKNILGREPSFAELGIFSVMWPEHCSLKGSLPWLRNLPQEGEKLLAKTGEENAGAVEIGNSLTPKNSMTRYLFDGVVRGIADYGNCFGVPTIGGEVHFEDNYQENPLVSVMALEGGYRRPKEMGNKSGVRVIDKVGGDRLRITNLVDLE